MSSKAVVDEAAKADNNVRVLVELIKTATEFKADTNQMATICGLTSAKNVPRKINAIIGPYGVELKGGKIVSTDGSKNEKSDKSPGSAKATPITPKTPQTSKTPKISKTPKLKASPKKRKLNHTTSEVDEAEGDGANMEDVEVDMDEAVKEAQIKSDIVKEEVDNEEPGMEEMGEEA